MRPSMVDETDAGKTSLFLGDWTDVVDSYGCDPRPEHPELDITG
jgi:hypothetical protein